MVEKNAPEIVLLKGKKLKKFQRETADAANWNMNDLRTICASLVRRILEEESHPGENSIAIVVSLKKEVRKIVRRAGRVGKQRNIPHFRYLEIRKEEIKKTQG